MKGYSIGSEDIDVKNSSMRRNLMKHWKRAGADLEMSRDGQQQSAGDTRSLIALWMRRKRNYLGVRVIAICGARGPRFGSQNFVVWVFWPLLAKNNKRQDSDSVNARTTQAPVFDCFV
jgi:hypothetical protein